MADVEASPDGPADRRRKLLVLLLIAFFFALQTMLVFRLNINWDEYWFLGRIYLAEAEQLRDPFQNFHVHLFGWITALPIGEIDQVIAGRLVMLLCQIMALACLYFVARKIADQISALLLVVLWFTSTYSLAHGASFRTDPIAAALLMAALALLMARPVWWRSIAAGIVAAASLLITVKGVFYLPAFAGAFAISWKREGLPGALKRFAMAAMATALSGLVLWLWHSAVLSGPSANAALSIDHGVSASESAAQKVIGDQGWFPRGDYILSWATGSFLVALALVLGVVIALKDFMRSKGDLCSLALLLCVLPLLSFALYRNAFPYFIPFILIPCLIAALPIAKLLVNDRRFFLEILLFACAAGTAAQFISYWPRDQEAQRAYTSAVHSLFPEPVAYIERSSMLPSFFKSGFFMSSWGIESSAGLDPPPVREAIERDAPPVLLVSSPAIAKALDPGSPYAKPRLAPEDESALRESFIQHWGDLWVAGKQLRETSGLFRLAIPGRYTLECQGERVISNRNLSCGAVVLLAKGEHRWSGGPIKIRWGRNLPVPGRPPPAGPIYHRF
ncbi:hypothetical protein ACXYL9_12555 [Qipengyuania sp. CAU 1752]